MIVTDEMRAALTKRGRQWGAGNANALAQLRLEVRHPATANNRYWRERMLGRQHVGDGIYITRRPDLDTIERRW